MPATAKPSKGKVLIEDYQEDGHRRITVNGKVVVFNDNQDEFTLWSMIDVLDALGVEWDQNLMDGSGGDDA